MPDTSMSVEQEVSSLSSDKEQTCTKRRLNIKKKKEQLGARRKARARVIDDELGKLIRQQTEDFMEKDWRTFVRDVRGRGDLQSTTPAMDEHPASQLIRHLAVRGAPAMMQTAPWTEAKIKSVLKRGPHRSCRDHLAFLREEILDFVRKGFWVMLPYRLLKKKMQKEGVLKRIRLSPPGVIPQRD